MNDLGNNEIFVKNLKYYMTINNKTRNDICQALEIPYTTFADWYNGKIYPRIDKIEMLANYFEIRKSDLVEDKTNKSTYSAIVSVYGTIPAGIPMEMIEDIIDTEEISIDMLKGNKQYFGLKIKGNSMNPDYLDGDTIILEKTEDCESGQDAVVMVNRKRPVHSKEYSRTKMESFFNLLIRIFNLWFILMSKLKLCQ